MVRRGRGIIYLLLFFFIFLTFISALDFNPFWNKMTGNQIVSFCVDTCSSLGYECGVVKICDQVANCGECSVGLECIEGQCIGNEINNITECFNTSCLTCNESRLCENSSYKCVNNKCSLAPTCDDSDLGISLYIRGNVTYSYNEFSIILNDKSVLEDYCYNTSHINEAFCFLDNDNVMQFGWENSFCRYGCFNGACKRLFGIFKLI